MRKERSPLFFAVVTLLFFLALFFGVRSYLVYGGSNARQFLFSEVLAGCADDASLAIALSLLTLLSLTLGKRFYFLTAFPLKLIIIITCYANLQYVNFFGENLRLFDFEYLRNMGSVWKTLFQDLWVHKAELLFLILPALVVVAWVSFLAKAGLRKFPLRPLLILIFAMPAIAAAAFFAGLALKDKNNLAGFHQSNYFLAMIKDIPSIRNYIKETRKIKGLKISLGDKSVVSNQSEPDSPDRRGKGIQNIIYRERPIPLPAGYVWYDDRYPFVKIPREDAAGMGLLSEAAPGSSLDQRPKTGRLRNVVFVLLESYRCREIDLFGGRYHLTPNMDALAAKSTLFKNFYCNSGWTAGAEFNSVTSFYDVFNGINATRSHYGMHLFSLPEILGLFGYSNFWMNAWPANFDNSRAFYKLHGNFTMIDKFSFPKTTTVAGWWYSDEELLKKAIETLDGARQPFFALILSSTNHMPYEVPEKRFELGLASGMFGRYLDTFHYTDCALGRFFEQLKDKGYFKNTVFFIFADTGNKRNDKKRVSEYQDFQNGYHIPLLIYDPASEKGTVVEDLGSELDLAPTVLEMLGIKIANHFIGQSLFQKKTSPFYLGYHGRGVPLVNYIDESKYCLYNAESGKLSAYGKGRRKSLVLLLNERRAIIFRIRQMLTLVDWSIYNDRVWDPGIDRYYKRVYQTR